MGSGVSPIIRMPQWWSRRWPPWDAPHRQKFALCIISLRVHAIPLRVALMPAVRYNLNGGLPTCIRFIIYQQYMVIAYCYVFFVNLIWYLYLFWLNKHCLSLSLSLSLTPCPIRKLIVIPFNIQIGLHSWITDLLLVMWKRTCGTHKLKCSRAIVMHCVLTSSIGKIAIITFAINHFSNEIALI